MEHALLVIVAILLGFGRGLLLAVNQESHNAGCDHICSICACQTNLINCTGLTITTPVCLPDASSYFTSARMCIHVMIRQGPVVSCVCQYPVLRDHFLHIACIDVCCSRRCSFNFGRFLYVLPEESQLSIEFINDFIQFDADTMRSNSQADIHRRESSMLLTIIFLPFLSRSTPCLILTPDSLDYQVGTQRTRLCVNANLRQSHISQSCV